MGLFKLRKNKRYSYSGRFSEDNNSTIGKQSGPIKIKSTLEDFRTNFGDNYSFRTKFRNSVNDYKKGSEKSRRNRLVTITLILVSILFLFYFI